VLSLEVCTTVVSWHGMAWHATDLPPRPPWHGMACAMICLSVCLSVCPCVDAQTVAVTNTVRSEKFREKRVMMRRVAAAETSAIRCWSLNAKKKSLRGMRGRGGTPREPRGNPDRPRTEREQENRDTRPTGRGRGRDPDGNLVTSVMVTSHQTSHHIPWYLPLPRSSGW
jgi:hypothetical protein